MDFTREPIIESVITPKEGCKLVIRSSKGVGQEEFFVDAVEVVSFGSSFFLRSLEKPKAFLVPATDYEILEVRETRMVLKNVGLDRSIKIGGGKEAVKQPAKSAAKPEIPEPESEVKLEPKRRERRRQYRRRRGKEGTQPLEQGSYEDEGKLEESIRLAAPAEKSKLENEGIGKPIRPTSAILSTLLPPPPTLISESIERYKGNELFKDVFIPKEDKKSQLLQEEEMEDEESTVDLDLEDSLENPIEDDLFSTDRDFEAEPSALFPREEFFPTHFEEPLPPSIPDSELSLNVEEESERDL